MKKTAFLSPLFLLAVPLIASAQTLQPIRTLISAIGGIVNALIPLLVGVAIVVFFWGLIKYIRTSGEGHAEGRNIMIAGLVSLFVMASLWGIISIIGTSLGIPDGARPVNQVVVPTTLGI